MTTPHRLLPRAIAALGRWSIRVVVAAFLLFGWGGLWGMATAAPLEHDRPSRLSDTEACCPDTLSERADHGDHEDPCEDCDDGGCADTDCMGALHSCGCCPNVAGTTSHAPAIPRPSSDDPRCPCTDDLQIREGVRARIDRPPRR
ncbi:MAG: hypothetical protein ACPHRO_10015 [Nannocystaceae bacterium]